MTIQGKRGMATTDQLTEAQAAARAAGQDFVPFEPPPEPGRRSRRKVVVDHDVPEVEVGDDVRFNSQGESWPAVVVKIGAEGHLFLNAFTTKGPRAVNVPYLPFGDPRDSWCLVADVYAVELIEAAGGVEEAIAVVEELAGEPEPKPKPAKKAAKKAAKKKAKS